MKDFFQFLIGGLTIGSIYALIGLGYCLIFISTRIINFAHGSLIQLGGIMALSMLLSWGLSYFSVFLLTFFIAAAIGVIFETFLVRPAGRSGDLSAILMTIGGFIFFQQVIYVFWTKDEVLFPPILGDEPLNWMGIMIIPQAIWILAITLGILFVLRIFFNRSIYGLAMMAAAEKPEAARLMGINVKLMTSLAWALATGLAGIVGILIAPITFAGGSLSMEIGIKGFVAAFLGGITRPTGVVLGGVLLGVIESLTTGYVSSGFKDAISFTLLILILGFRPEGILGKFQKEKI
jgi:branched-chain amino acid transport system permease protein